MKTLFFILILSIFLGCNWLLDNNNGDTKVVPVNPCNLETTADEYIWEVDTIGVTNSNLGDFWVFSDSSIFAMGIYLYSPLAPTTSQIGFYYNGNSWSNNLFATSVEIGHGTISIAGTSDYFVSVGNLGPGANRMGLGEFNNKTKKWTKHQFNDSGELSTVWTDGKGYYIAGGYNGLLYIKNGQNDSWVKSVLSSDYHLFDLVGTEKKELFVKGIKTTGSVGKIFDFNGSYWKIIHDTEDQTNKYPIQLFYTKPTEYITGILFSEYCSVTDSVSLYIQSNKSLYRFSKHYGDSVYKREDFSNQIGLAEAPVYSKIISPNDVWIFATKVYHWNGRKLTEQKLPYYLPSPLLPIKNVRRSKSGKVYIGIEYFATVLWYVGTPK